MSGEALRNYFGKDVLLVARFDGALGAIGIWSARQ